MARPMCEEHKSSRDMVPSSSVGFCYADVSSSGNIPTTLQTHLVNQIQEGFVSDDPEMFNLTTGMEMIGFSKNHVQQQQQQSDANNAVMWKSLLGKSHGPSSSSKTCMNDHSSPNFYHQYSNNKHDFTSGISAETSSENLIVQDSSAASWQENNRLLVDDSSLRCVFPCEGNERPSQGLSLSLSSTNPSSIGLQSFELRQTCTSQPADFVASSSSREGFFGKSPPNTQQHQQQMLQDGYLSSTRPSSSTFYQGGQFLLKNSKYLLPAQDLLNEFCSLATTKQNDLVKQKSSLKNKQLWEEDNGITGSSKKHSLTSLEFMELQKRKTKLLSMLEEVDRRYRHYRNQMKAVVSSFEAVAGNGAATVYSALALKAMSRHFKCLKDGISGQLQATRKAMGEKDPVAPGTTRGETPRLKVIDQALRQQRAFQQISMMETHPWRPQRGLPERSVSVLRAWLFEHFLHPYPSDVDKHILARQTGLSRSQVSNWFINARVRLWKPMVEEMYLEEVKEHENNMGSSEVGTEPDEDMNGINVLENLPPSPRSEDQKPTPDRLIRIDTDCASSLINNHNPLNNKNDPTKINGTKSTLHNQHHLMNPQEQCLGRVTDTFGSMELDFSSYTHHHSTGMVTYPISNDDHNSNLQLRSFNGGGGGGVSLTLGLQQHGESGVSLAFPSANQSSMFYQRDHHQIEECQVPPVHHQYSLLDGEGQNLPYRNLIGAQLLHDLAG